MTVIDRGLETCQGRILLWGCEGCGKTSFLATLRRLLDPGGRTRLFRLADPSGRTLFFDLLALPEMSLHEMRIRPRLLAVPGRPDAAGQRRTLLASAAVVVFLIDARASALKGNRASLEELLQARADLGIEDRPVLYALNRREPDAAAAADLGPLLALEEESLFDLSTAEGDGVLEVFGAAYRALIHQVAAQSGFPDPSKLESSPARLIERLARLEGGHAGEREGDRVVEVDVPTSGGEGTELPWDARALEVQVRLAEMCGEMDERVRILEERNGELMAINRVGRSILTALETENLLVVLLDATTEHLGASHASCVLFRGSDQGSLCTHVLGFGRDPALGLAADSAREFLDVLRRAEGPVPVDSERNASLLSALRKVDRRIAAAVFQPMRSGSRPAGWLALYSVEEERLPSVNGLLFLSTIGRLASLGLEKMGRQEELERARVRLEANLRSQVSKLEMANAKVRALNRGLESRVNERTRDLKAQNRALREAQAEAVRSEGLRGMGHVAAALAHEVNNPVAGLQSNLTFMRDSLEELKARVAVAGSEAADGLAAVEEFEEILDESMQSARRVQDVIASLKRFGGEEEAPETVSLNAAVADAVTLLEERIRPCGGFDLKLGQIPEVAGDAQALRHAVLAILTNAVEALEHSCGKEDKGRIEVVSYVSGGKVTLTVRDSGGGIAPDLLPRVFDPFVSTKEGVPNAGLGLHTAYRAVRDQGGTIKIRSKPGQGALVTMVLPVERSKTEQGAPG